MLFTELVEAEGAVVPLVGGEGARLFVLPAAAAPWTLVFEDLRLEPTKFLKRWFIADDINTCESQRRRVEVWSE